MSRDRLVFPGFQKRILWRLRYFYESELDDVVIVLACTRSCYEKSSCD